MVLLYSCSKQSSSRLLTYKNEGKLMKCSQYEPALERVAIRSFRNSPILATQSNDFGSPGSYFGFWELFLQTKKFYFLLILTTIHHFSNLIFQSIGRPNGPTRILVSYTKDHGRSSERFNWTNTYSSKNKISGPTVPLLHAFNRDSNGWKLMHLKRE